MVRAVELPDWRRLASVLNYDPLTGNMTWIPRQECEAWSDAECRRWNFRFAGKDAGVIHKPTGYKVLCVFSRQLKFHRVCYAIHNETNDLQVIDHKNGDRLDNRAENLVSVTYKQNSRNRKINSTNRSGVAGVIEKGGLFVAYIGSGPSRIIGSYISMDLAKQARAAAEKELGYIIRG